MIIVYSALFGEYDTFVEPSIVDPNARYILFTDQPIVSKVWEVRQRQCLKGAERTQARYYKANTNELPEHTLSIWIDARFTPTCSDWSLFNGVALGAFKHDQRDCIYAESAVCKDMRLDNPKHIDQLLTKLANDSYPRFNGLVSSGFLVRTSNALLRSFNAMWWHYISTYSIRDQLSFNYVAWKQGIQVQYLEPGNVYGNPYLSKHRKHLQPRTYGL